MKNYSVIFDYSLNWKSIELEKDYVHDLDFDGLKSILNGSIYVMLEPGRNYIRINSGIIDYLDQFTLVIAEIDAGNYNTFSVSCDFYSNSFDYNFDEKSNQLRIIESNEQEFDFTTNYQTFKESFLTFKKKTIDDILLIHPNLNKNQSFINWCNTF